MVAMSGALLLRQNMDIANSNHPAWIALGSLLCVASAGCDNGASTEPIGSGGAGGANTGGNAAEYAGSVSGTVIDEDGNPIETLGVSLCFTVCRVVETDATGAFTFMGIEPATQVIENIGWPTTDPISAALVYTKFFDFVTIGVDEAVTIERPFVMRRVDTDGPLTGAQQLTLAGGLEIGFDADLFGTTDNPLPSPAMELYFGAVEIPERDWPTRGHEGWRILRAWGLAVWDLHRDDAFVVSAPLGTAGPLPAGSEVAFLVADYTYGFQNGVFFEEAATLSADGTTLSTASDGGLDRSTMWLAVVRDEP
jgi:hypothetical protein